MDFLQSSCYFQFFFGWRGRKPKRLNMKILYRDNRFMGEKLER